MNLNIAPCEPSVELDYFTPDGGEVHGFFCITHRARINTHGRPLGDIVCEAYEGYEPMTEPVMFP